MVNPLQLWSSSLLWIVGKETCLLTSWSIFDLLLGFFLHHSNDFLFIHQTCAPHPTMLSLIYSFTLHTCFFSMCPTVDFGKPTTIGFCFLVTSSPLILTVNSTQLTGLYYPYSSFCTDVNLLKLRLRFNSLIS